MQNLYKKQNYFKINYRVNCIVDIVLIKKTFNEPTIEQIRKHILYLVNNFLEDAIKTSIAGDNS
jgi:hypothetical protein